MGTGRRGFTFLGGAACLAFLLAAAAEESGGVFDDILAGVTIGASVDFFKVAHSDAVETEVKPLQPPAPTEKKTQTFQEQFERDPWLGLWHLGNYGFREEKLDEFTLLWQGTEENVLALREKFFAACIAKHGRILRREAMKIDSGVNEHLTPVVVWYAGDYAILASYALHTSKGQASRGSFSYAVFPRRDPFLQEQLCARTLKPRELDRVFVGLDTIINKILIEVPEIAAPGNTAGTSP